MVSIDDVWKILQAAGNHYNLCLSIFLPTITKASSVKFITITDLHIYMGKVAHMVVCANSSKKETCLQKFKKTGKDIYFQEHCCRYSLSFTVCTLTFCVAGHCYNTVAGKVESEKHLWR